ncbi:putative Mu-like phage protein [Campylobacter pinnipediorum subsp. caledonicus]|uniref:phage tail assembly protein n=1 Tax=Campylobacter pinnipediorum TaxID=1965231 RepID=UPI0009955C82|nr:phage tail assembly protein [Campylobacter pinnipediorum]AQW85494.1 putative Mu-like phage protein [Campylobacter pinnipediorum subsp. caledonicus]
MRKVKVKLEVKGEEIEVCAPTVRAVRMASNDSKSEIEQSIKICAVCANMTEKEIDELDMQDFNAIQKVVQDFLGVAGVVA